VTPQEAAETVSVVIDEMWRVGGDSFAQRLMPVRDLLRAANEERVADEDDRDALVQAFREHYPDSDEPEFLADVALTALRGQS